MPDEKRDLFRYTNYFSKEAPALHTQSIILLALGVVTGILSILLIHPQDFIQNIVTFTGYGLSSGLLIVSLPALFTIAMIKALKRNIFLKHLMYATIVSTTMYALFLIVSSAFFSLFHSLTISYVIFLVGNASIYLFWIVIGKFLFAQRRGGNILPAIQPILNIMFYIPLGKYLLDFNFSFSTALTKLFFGMLIFLIAGYLVFYLLDAPMKRATNISGIKIFTIMVNQWLYNPKTDTNGEQFAFGEKKDITTDILLLKNRKGRYSAIFVKPDIHYGPFAGFGGAITTEYLGNYLHNKYNATAFVLHGPVNIANNPVSSSQVYTLAKNISSYIDSVNPNRFTAALGNIYSGSKGPCNAIHLKINDCSMVTLSKAPLVTEDINYEIGMHYKKLAARHSSNAIIIDAHNSRSESASKEELKGIYFGSKYVSMYENAILQTLGKNSVKKMRFGSSQQKISSNLGNPKDLGNGYSSFALFQFGGKKFGMLYFDSNNILPKLREDVIRHVKGKYHIDIEVYTTDTHSVNSLALPSSNVLGRFTIASKLLPVVDAMIDMAVNSTEEVSAASGSFVSKGFRVWGENAEAAITKASKEAIRMVKHVAPFVIAAAFVIAAWVVYSV
ncbi:MAG: DUF2070 family protein [Candidatus Micrarchaeota archaeon]|nr:DUF2070 family protein [Candidatus Micrarchaeota archaeon]